MPRNSAALAVIVVIACVFAMTLWWRNAERAESAASETAAVSPLATEDDDIVGAVPHATASAPGIPPQDPDLLEMQRAEEKRGVDAIVNAGRDKLAGKFQSEAVDQQWASAKQGSLTSLQSGGQIDQIDAKPVAFDVACRTSTCRIQAEFGSRIAADDWTTLYLLQTAKEISNASFKRTDYPDGTASVEIYGKAR